MQFRPKIRRLLLLFETISRETPCAQQEQAGHFISCLTPPVLSYSIQQCCLYLELHEPCYRTAPWMDLQLDAHSSYTQYKVQICCSCMSLCSVNFMYRLYHDCTRTLKGSLSGKLAIVELSGNFGFARNSSKHPCTLASFSRAHMPRSACTCDVTCELHCN